MERRNFPRIAAKIGARFLINDRVTGDGAATNISASGMVITSDADVANGDRVVLHFDGGGRIEAAIARIFEGGFGVNFVLTDVKQDRLRQSLRDNAKPGSPLTQIPIDRRIDGRVNAFRAETMCHTANGDVVCRIVDMSLSGIAIETDADIEIGVLVCVGRISGRIMRRDGSIYGVQFDDATSADEATSADNAICATR